MRSLWYNHKFKKDYPVLCKNNNACKELSAAAIFRLICNTIVDSHASLEKSKSLPKTDKVRKVRGVTTSLQLFVKVDLQTVMKASRWSSGGTFTCFYFRPLSLSRPSTQDGTLGSEQKSSGSHLGIQSDCRFPSCPLVKPRYQLAAVP